MKYYNYLLLDTRYPGEWEIEEGIVAKYKPFYVGKGTGNRVKCHFRDSDKVNRIKHEKISDIIKETGSRPEYIQFYFTDDEQLSLDNETRLIKLIREKFGNILTNVASEGYKKPCVYGKDNPSSKVVYQFTLDCILVTRFDSITEASKATGVNISRISDCCHGIRNRAGNYRWSFNDNLKIDNTIRTQWLLKRRVIAYTGSSETTFDSIDSAYKFLNKRNKGHIKRCIENPNLSYMGFKWKLASENNN